MTHDKYQFTHNFCLLELTYFFFVDSLKMDNSKMSKRIEHFLRNKTKQIILAIFLALSLIILRFFFFSFFFFLEKVFIWTILTIADHSQHSSFSKFSQPFENSFSF